MSFDARDVVVLQVHVAPNFPHRKSHATGRRIAGRKFLSLNARAKKGGVRRRREEEHKRERVEDDVETSDLPVRRGLGVARGFVRGAVDGILLALVQLHKTPRPGLFDPNGRIIRASRHSPPLEEDGEEEGEKSSHETARHGSCQLIFLNDAIATLRFVSLPPGKGGIFHLDPFSWPIFFFSSPVLGFIIKEPY